MVAWRNDPIRLAKYKRKQSVILKRRMSDPIERARMYSWKDAPEKMKRFIEKTSAWLKDKEKVHAATIKRMNNPHMIAHLKKYQLNFVNMTSEQKSEAAKRAHLLHPNLAKHMHEVLRNNPEKARLAHLKSLTTQNANWRDPVYRAGHLTKMHSREWTEERRQKARAKILSHPRCQRDNVIELMLQNELRALGIQFTTHKPLLGICVPDIIIDSGKLAVFADGCYYHRCKLHCRRLNGVIPIQTETRDARQNMVLIANGWLPLRFWEHEIKSNLDECVEEIVLAYMQRHILVEDIRLREIN